MKPQRWFAIAALLWVAALAGAQGKPAAAIDPAGASGRVYLSTMAGGEAGFGKLFETPVYQEYRPFAVLLVNGSERNIVALRIKWTVKWGERSGVYTSGTDSLGLSVGGTGVSAPLPMPGQDPRSALRLGASYSAAEGVVAAPGERVLGAPGLFVRESLAGQGRSGGFASFPDAFRTADNVTATLEAVVLEDGEVMGANPQPLIDSLKASKAAVDDLVSRVRAAEANGEDGAAALRNIAQQRPASREQFPQLEERSLARRLMLSRDWKAQLETLAGKKLPDFHR
jgi:hypothetical protein